MVRGVRNELFGEVIGDTNLFNGPSAPSNRKSPADKTHQPIIDSPT